MRICDITLTNEYDCERQTCCYFCELYDDCNIAGKCDCYEDEIDAGKICNHLVK